MSRRYSYSQIKSRLSQFYPRPGCGCEYQTGYRAALDEVLLSFSPETFFAQVDRNPEGHDPEEGHGAKHESPVGEADAPEHSIHSSSGRG